MGLQQADIEAIKKVVTEAITPLQTELEEIKQTLIAIKKDTNLLSKLNQLDEIRRDGRLRKLYDEDDRLEM